MSRSAITGCAIAAILLLVAFAIGYRALERGAAGSGTVARALPSASASEVRGADPRGFLYGRVTTRGGGTYEGRLRFGGREEAFWSDGFYGVRRENPWAAQVPAERLVESLPIEIFGLAIGERTRPVDLRRPFAVPFGDLVRIEAEGRDVRVTRKSGSVVTLDRWEAGDFDDGVRVWDAERGAVDLDAAEIRRIELLATPQLAVAPRRLHGTVRSRQGELRGFVRWDGELRMTSDELVGRDAVGRRALRFDEIRAIAREGAASSRVTLADGRELVLSGTSAVGAGHRGVVVDDRRYGRVRVAWGAFERLDLDEPGAAGSGPAYDDIPPGRPLSGSVVSRDSRRLVGRLVFDLDESETADALDAPDGALHHSIPFGLVAAIDLAGERVRVTLRGGEDLQLERRDDLGDENLGLLVFAAGGERAVHLPWPEVARVELDPPREIAPPPAISR